jgi:hypothetical protein
VLNLWRVRMCVEVVDNEQLWQSKDWGSGDCEGLVKTGTVEASH